MDSLDKISVLPKMREPREKNQTFRLIWVLDLVSESSRTYINLVFQNTRTGFVLVDKIPPELLFYCTVGSYFKAGEKLSDEPFGVSWDFAIDTRGGSTIHEVGHVIGDHEYDLRLNSLRPGYTNLCRQQYCFVQQVGSVKVVLPCFVAASVYYFRSTGLREAIMARRLPRLVQSCDLDPTSWHATIHLSSEANVSDAPTIARFMLDSYAFQRINLCKDHHYASSEQTYRRLYADVPVQQFIPMQARGIYTEDQVGNGTFVVFEILQEDSYYPFQSIDVYYQSGEAASEEESEATSFPQKHTKSKRVMTTRAPSSGLVRHLLATSSIAVNNNLNSINENRIPVCNMDDLDSPMSYPDYSDQSVELSSQPDFPGDLTVAPVAIQEPEIREKNRFEFSLLHR